MSHPPEILLFLGRFHVLLLHLPIGFILLLGILELLGTRPRFQHLRSSTGLILSLVVAVATVTALAGYLLSLAGGYDARLLRLHLWTGVATAIACVVAGLLHWRHQVASYRVTLAVTIGLLVVASHYGGSLTHGSDHLVHYAPEPFRTWFGGSPKIIQTVVEKGNVLDHQAYAAVAKPVLQKYCVDCHGPEKSKGNLRLDTYQLLLGGGDYHVALVPGKAAESPMVKHMRLPIEEDNHMPPDGKPQPSEDEIALLEWWIGAGAPEKEKVEAIKPPEKILRLLQARSGGEPQRKTRPPVASAQVMPAAAKLAQDLGIAISPLSATEPWLQVNAGIAGTNFGNGELEKLAVGVGPNVRWLELAGTRVDDEGLTNLAQTENLQRLHLQRTAVTDAGLVRLTLLKDLEFLNLYSTQVSDAGLETLRQMPKLRRAYLWQTKVTPEAAKGFVLAKTDTLRIKQLEAEIEKLKGQIQGAQVSVELGVQPATASTNAVPLNTACPVSGKPVDVAQTLMHEGQLIAFCCADCKAKFQQDPKPFLTRLNVK